MLADSPKGYWKLDDATGTTATDSSGNAHHGTYTGGFTLASGTDPHGDHGVLLDGTSGYVTVASHTDFQVTAVTVEAWFKADAGSSGERCLASKNGTTDYMLERYGAVGFLTRASGGLGVTDVGTADNAIWHHAAFTNDATRMRLHVDGELVDDRGSGPMSTSATALLIGQYGAANFFKGVISKAAVYPTALSPYRIMVHYLSGLGAKVTA